MTHDAVGNLTDDGEHYEYVWDAFGRLRKVLDRTDDSLVAEYTYNGLNHLLSVHQDTDLDDDVDATDVWFHFAYDDRWRVIATFREADSDAKEAFVYQAAGLDGSGSSSYIDSVILRDRDADTAWTAASDGVLEQRAYYCQNWRADVVALISDGRKMVEWAKYSAYGIPFGLPAGDADSDGDCDATDLTQIQTWINASSYDVRGDLDLDGDVDATDKSIAQSTFRGVTLGWDALSDRGNRKGYAGYEYDQAVSVYHVRNRVLDPHLGRWLRRDPLGYVDGMSLYEYVGSRAVVARDAWGMTFVYSAQPDQNDCLSCYDEISQDPEIIDLVNRIKALDACKDNWSEVPDFKCFSNEFAGHTDKRTSKITICCKDIKFRNDDNSFNCEEFKRTYKHELIHAYDYCQERSTEDDEDSEIESILKECGVTTNVCTEALCSEVRGYTFSGECDEGSWLFEDCKQKGHCSDKESCVKYWASKSVLEMSGVCAPATVSRYINSVYECCASDNHNPYP